MTTTHKLSAILTRALALASIAAALSCAKGDVGAPCNHGQVEPPESKLVTFPALSCNELLCIYADVAEAPDDSCTDSSVCNASDPGKNRFECVIPAGDNSGTCKLKIEYVLERSMCSKKCSTNADCKDGGPTKKVVVENTKCASGFTCAKIQTLGQFCCESLCVCNDDLDVATESDIRMACESSTQEGCCTGPAGFVPSPACGP
ncbi:MAG TPA: hypothetical protein VG755_09185 [Nannocystaceae bacterium]|nr:hypothetical protein [Nannocystaceae bacterium]